jgi:hypothetical protein
MSRSRSRGKGSAATSHRSAWRASAFGFGALLLVSCSGSTTCSELPLGSHVEETLADTGAQLDWAPVLPCGYGRGLVIASAFITQVGGEPALTLTVARNDQPRFVFTQATAGAGADAIPRGSRRVSLEVAGQRAAGFEEPLRSGGSMLYLRWEVGPRVFEYQATIASGFIRTGAYRTAEAIIERTADQPER